VPVWWCGESFWPGSKVTSTTVALAAFPSSFSMMSRRESWVTFTALWWSWSAANVTATPTPMPAASVNKVRTCPQAARCHPAVRPIRPGRN
jgi:hypothetical protein